jgi:hypothetical protein
MHRCTFKTKRGVYTPIYTTPCCAHHPGVVMVVVYIVALPNQTMCDVAWTDLTNSNNNRQAATMHARSLKCVGAKSYPWLPTM